MNLVIPYYPKVVVEVKVQILLFKYFNNSKSSVTSLLKH